ncbi:hypothetical protein [Arthrobacter sp. EpRS71]|uniref:hypothetical protein n=1 Tax=Arthrobacter sp. EpRS71 TaxID=1743141 RepID=UPI000747542B|nr:hypothetical protein [Arthrobacter sp. EpRS71]KUM40900.1 hypothetical protein AR689_05950 [Arthrobacter sp. EpRS71]
MEPDWIEHRRADDREHVGWMKPVDELGLRYLADPHELLLDDGAWLRVRIAEVTASVVRVKKEDWGDMTAPQIYFTVPNPVSEEQLRPLLP